VAEYDGRTDARANQHLGQRNLLRKKHRLGNFGFRDPILGLWF